MTSTVATTAATTGGRIAIATIDTVRANRIGNRIIVATRGEDIGDVMQGVSINGTCKRCSNDISSPSRGDLSITNRRGKDRPLVIAAIAVGADKFIQVEAANRRPAE